MKLNTAFTLALAALCSVSVLAQDKKAAQPLTPKLVIESLTHDFGEVKSGEPLSFIFRIKNEGGADLMIKSVTPG